MNFFTAEIEIAVNGSQLSVSLKKAEGMADASAKKIEQSFSQGFAKRMDADLKATQSKLRMEKLKQQAIDRTAKEEAKAARAAEYAAERRFKGMVRLFASGGVYTMAARYAAELGGNLLEAHRKGESLWAAFENSVPMLGGVAKGLHKIADELSGIAVTSERTAANMTYLTVQYKNLSDLLNQQKIELGGITSEDLAKQIDFQRYSEEHLKRSVELQKDLDAAIKQRDWLKGPGIHIAKTSENIRKAEQEVKYIQAQFDQSFKKMKALTDLRQSLPTPPWVSQVPIFDVEAPDKEYEEAMKAANRLNDYELGLLKKQEDAEMDLLKKQKETIREKNDYERGVVNDHTNWLRSQEQMSLDEKIENLDREMEAKREAWGEESEALKELAEERERYQRANIQGWEAVGVSVRVWANESMNWGKKLGGVMTSTFDEAAGNFADMLMQEEVDWKAFGRGFIKQLLEMIIQMEIAYVLKTLLGFSPTPAPAGNAPLGSIPAGMPGAADGGYVEKTGLARIHKGETITPAGGGNMVVNVINNTSAEIQVGNSYMQSNQRIIDVTIHALGNNGPLRRAVGGVRK